MGRNRPPRAFDIYNLFLKPAISTTHTWKNFSKTIIYETSYFHGITITMV